MRSSFVAPNKICNYQTTFKLNLIKPKYIIHSHYSKNTNTDPNYPSFTTEILNNPIKNQISPHLFKTL